MYKLRITYTQHSYLGYQTLLTFDLRAVYDE